MRNGAKRLRAMPFCSLKLSPSIQSMGAVMPATNTLDFSNAQAAAKALKKVSQIMIRAGQPVVSSEFNEKSRRVAGVTYREATLTVASGQMVVLRVNLTGDIFQVKLNGAQLPIKNQTDSASAVAEIAAMLEKNQVAFQKAQARKQIALPKGMTTPTPKQAVVYAERVAQLDTQIAERKANVADLQKQLGAMTDSLEPNESKQPLPPAEEQGVAWAYVAAREIVLAYPAMLDSVATAGAVAQLRMALEVVETNAPINEAEGNLDQAELERSLAKSFITAIAMLDSIDAPMNDEGLDELINIAAVSAADISDIKNQPALAQLLKNGLVETTEGLYMLTDAGKSALEDAGYDAYGEPFGSQD